MKTNFSHALIVGGTGMLKGAAATLSHRATVSIIARNPSDLNPSIRQIHVDYRKTDEFLAQISRAASEVGPIDLAVVWIHSTAPESPLGLARLLDEQSIPCRYFHVLGSAHADPTQTNDPRNAAYQRFRNLKYRQLILGFMLEKNRSRWLTNAEISQGVLQAIEGDAERSIVGVVEPWSARP